MSEKAEWWCLTIALLGGLFPIAIATVLAFFGIKLGWLVLTGATILLFGLLAIALSIVWNARPWR